MARKTYSEKLRDPRWQRKRLEVMQRDNFECKWCMNNEKTLNVHHLQYSGEPWDTPIEHLITLCEDCHKDDHDMRKCAEDELLKTLKLAGYSYDHITWLSFAIKKSIGDPWIVTQVLAKNLQNRAWIERATNELFGR